MLAVLREPASRVRLEGPHKVEVSRGLQLGSTVPALSRDMNNEHAPRNEFVTELVVSSGNLLGTESLKDFNLRAETAMGRILQQNSDLLLSTREPSRSTVLLGDVK